MSRQRSLETILKAEYVTIGELVRLTDTRYSTLKYYTEEGMLPFEQEEENLTRRYPREANIRRIQEIKELRKEGMTISEIKKFCAEIIRKPAESPDDEERGAALFCSCSALTDLTILTSPPEYAVPHTRRKRRRGTGSG